MITFRITKPGFDPTYQPNLEFVKFYFVDFNRVQYKIRQKYKEIEYRLRTIRQYSSCDIRLLVDPDYSVIYDFTNQRMLYQHDNMKSVAPLMFHLEQLTALFRYDRYPETITTISIYNHYKSLLKNYYGKEERNH